MIPIDSSMVDLRLNDLGQIELGQFGEETEDIIWETCYPELRTLLSNVADQLGHSVDVDLNVYTKTALGPRKEALNTFESPLRVT